jgi:hypothetical protein
VFEYQVGISTNREPVSPPFTSPERPKLGQFGIVSNATLNSRGVIKIPRAQYRRWMYEITTHPVSYR